MKKLIVLFLLMTLPLFFATSTAAATLKKGNMTCLSKDYLKEAVTTSTNKDKRGWMYLVENLYCIIAAQDYQASVLDVSFGIRKIRVYVSGESIVLWTLKENVTPRLQEALWISDIHRFKSFTNIGNSLNQ